MSRRAIWHAQAMRDLRRLDAESRRRVAAAVNRLAATEEGDVVRLRNYQPPTWRLRVGDWRVLFRFEGSDVLHIVGVLHRREAYR